MEFDYNPLAAESAEWQKFLHGIWADDQQSIDTLAEMFGYSTDVRSLSKGRASYSMEPANYEPVPAQILKQVVETSSRAPART